MKIVRAMEGPIDADMAFHLYRLRIKSEACGPCAGGADTRGGDAPQRKD